MQGKPLSFVRPHNKILDRKEMCNVKCTAGTEIRSFTVVVAAAYRIHRHLIATRETWVRPVSSALGSAVGAIGVAFLVIGIAN